MLKTSPVYRTILYLQVVLSLEGFRALAARVLPLVAVRQLVLGQRARVVEQLAADWAANDRPHSVTLHGRPRRPRRVPIAAVSRQPARMVSGTTTEGPRLAQLGPGVSQVDVVHGQLTCSHKKSTSAFTISYHVSTSLY